MVPNLLQLTEGQPSKVQKSCLRRPAYDVRRKHFVVRRAAGRKRLRIDLVDGSVGRRRLSLGATLLRPDIREADSCQVSQVSQTVGRLQVPKLNLFAHDVLMGE